MVSYAAPASVAPPPTAASSPASEMQLVPLPAFTLTINYYELGGTIYIFVASRPFKANADIYSFKSLPAFATTTTSPTAPPVQEVRA